MKRLLSFFIGIAALICAMAIIIFGSEKQKQYYGMYE
jgi:hypothetical protein